MTSADNNASEKESGGTTNRWQEQLNYVYDKADRLTTERTPSRLWLVPR